MVYFDQNLQWFNEPPKWSIADNKMTVTTAPKTDFWRVTHYDFIRDSGHFCFEQVDVDFVLEVKLYGDYRDLYDQAGIMIRSDEKHWIKTGIEYVNGVQHLSAVVTHEYSDWSVIPLSVPLMPLQLRVERRKEAIHIFYLDKNAQYAMIRLAYFPVTSNIQVGLMCASPEGDGFEVTFEDYHLEKLPLLE